MYCVIIEDFFEVKICKIIVYVLLFVFLFLGNMLIIMVVCWDKKMRIIINLFIVNMVVFDFFVLVFVMFWVSVEIFFGNFWWLIGGVFGEVFCKVIVFF